MTVCGCRRSSRLLLAAALFPWLYGAAALGTTAGLVIYKDNSFDPDSQAEIATFSSVQHFTAVDAVLTTGGATLRLQSGQEPIYIPQAGDPDSTAEEATGTILGAERRFPQFTAKLEILRQRWAALPKAAPAVTTGRAISASAESTSTLTADEWKKKATEEYPGLAVVGSPLNAAFVAKYKAYQGSNYFDTPDWPMRLAKECAQATPVRSPASLADRLANTSWNDANKEDSQGNQKSFTLNPDMTVRANWRHKELGWWKVLDDTRIELHVARDTSVRAVLVFNEDLTEATDDDNQSYHRLNPPASQTTAQVQPSQQAGAPAPAKVLRTKSGGVFQSWSVTRIDGDTVVISHADGISRIPISDLPDDLSGFSPEVIARAQQLRQQAAAVKQKQTPIGTDTAAINAAIVAEGGKPSSLIPGIAPAAPGANGNAPTSAISAPWSTATASVSPAEKTFAEKVADAQSEMKEHTQDGDDVRARLKDESAGKLVVKGLFLGMNFNDCYAAFQPFGKDTWYLEKGVRKVDGNDMLCFTFISQRFTMGGRVLAYPDTKKVARFFFDRPLSDFLFDCDDLDASDFAQQFINSYPVPDLKPGVRNGRQVWIHDDPDGWSLLITPNKDVDVSFTKSHSFGD